MKEKIAIISPGLLPVPAVKGGAVEVLTTNIIDGLEREGKIDYDVYTVPDDKIDNARYTHGTIIAVNISCFDKIVAKLGNAICKLVRKKWRFRPYHIGLLRKIGLKRYKYVLVENNMELYFVIHCFTRNKNNLVFHLHNDIDNYSKSPERCKFICETAQCIMVVSEYLRQRVLQVQKDAKVYVLPNAIDTECFKYNESKRKELRTKYGVDDSAILIMYSGRIDPMKGVLELAKAFVELERKNINCVLMIVGQGWFGQERVDDYTRTVQETFKNSKNVILTGFISPEEIPAYVSMSDIVVIPSICQEAFGLVAIEAMSGGRCIVATKSGGLKEILDDECAIMIPNDDGLTENIYVALDEVINNPEYRKKLGIQAYKKVKKHKEYDAKYYYENYKALVGIQ